MGPNRSRRDFPRLAPLRCFANEDQTVGRRTAYNAGILILCLCSVGTALSINMAMFTTMRILAGFEGTFQMVAGQTIIADIFDPVCCYYVMELCRC